MGRTDYWQVQDLKAIRREVAFDEIVTELCENFTRMYQLDFAIDWAMSRFREDIFNDVSDNHYIWKTLIIQDFPRLLITFRFDKTDNIIYMLGIKVLPNDSHS